MLLVVILVTGKEEEGSDCGKRRFHVLRTALPLGCVRASLVHKRMATTLLLIIVYQQECLVLTHDIVLNPLSFVVAKKSNRINVATTIAVATALSDHQLPYNGRDTS
jgi:hypothetical protein